MFLIWVIFPYKYQLKNINPALAHYRNLSTRIITQPTFSSISRFCYFITFSVVFSYSTPTFRSIYSFCNRCRCIFWCILSLAHSIRNIFLCIDFWDRSIPERMLSCLKNWPGWRYVRDFSKVNICTSQNRIDPSIGTHSKV